LLSQKPPKLLLKRQSHQGILPRLPSHIWEICLTVSCVWNTPSARAKPYEKDQPSEAQTNGGKSRSPVPV
jgi:hypothetical protein